MKYAEFMTAITDIYGPYSSPILEQITFKYIKERFSEADLQAIIEKLILKKSAKYKTPPDPAEFEELFPRVSLDAEANDWYNRLSNTGNSLDNVVISEIRAQNAIESFGGWVDFCQRNPDYEGLHRKNFIEAYMKGGAGESRILYGASSRKYNREALPFGDTEKCKLIISAQKPPEAIEDMTRFTKEKSA